MASRTVKIRLEHMASRGADTPDNRPCALGHAICTAVGALAERAAEGLRQSPQGFDAGLQLLPLPLAVGKDHSSAISVNSVCSAQCPHLRISGSIPFFS